MIRTSNICNAEDSNRARLNDAALIRQERRCPRLGEARGAVLEKAWTSCVRWRLRRVSQAACALECDGVRRRFAYGKQRSHGRGRSLCKRYSTGGAMLGMVLVLSWGGNERKVGEQG